jgi:hypothetical protein
MSSGEKKHSYKSKNGSSSSVGNKDKQEIIDIVKEMRLRIDESISENKTEEIDAELKKEFEEEYLHFSMKYSILFNEACAIEFDWIRFTKMLNCYLCDSYKKY